MNPDRNIVLIGMPGVGKSTVGVLLAKASGRSFVDTDVFIQVLQGEPLQTMLDRVGLDEFCRLEQQHVLSLEVTGHVVATGGSVIYSPAAMSHLRSGGVIVWLDLPIEILERRIDNLATRGLVIQKGQTLPDLNARRRPLYQQWAQVAIDCTDKTQDQIVADIIATLDDAT